MPRMVGLRVVRSSIHGYGVVAGRDFAVGELLAEVDGLLWQEQEEHDDRYSLWMGDGWYFDMLDQTRWINHSCEPNAEIEADFDEHGTAWARLIALRPIRAGEEITYDYAFDVGNAEPCACGARRCRGWIVDEDELHLILSGRAATPRRAS
jgi:hypothetical protein